MNHDLSTKQEMDILNELNLGDPENRPFLLQSIHDISMQITQSNIVLVYFGEWRDCVKYKILSLNKDKTIHENL